MDVSFASICTDDWTFRWQIRPFNNSASVFIIVHQKTGNCLAVNPILNQTGITYRDCTSPLTLGSLILFNIIPINYTAYTWNLVSLHTGGSITVTSKQTNIWALYSPSNVTQQYRFVVIPPPPGRLSLWTLPIKLPLIAIAASNLADGRIVMWSAAEQDNYNPIIPQTYVAYYDPQSGNVSEKLITTLQADMFCPGTAKTFDGSVMVVGGLTSGATNVYNESIGSWARSSKLNIPRGYNAAVTLSNGNVFTLGGSWSGAQGNKEGEVWTAGSGWRVLSHVIPGPFLTADKGGVWRQDNHMWLFAVSDGWVFHAGPSKAMHWVNTSGQGSIISVGNRSNDTDAMNGNAVLYDAVLGKILAVGGAPSYNGGVPTANAFIIDISGGPGGNVTVRRIQSMNVSRAFHNSVLLPNGEVVVVGGQSLFSTPFQDSNAVMFAEIWCPVTEKFSILTWSANATSMLTPRTYHSVGLLLPDGRVLSSGGGACGTLCAYNHLDAQIITPPYLLNPDGTPALRPLLVWAPSKTFLGATIQVTATGAQSFVLMRSMSNTHTVNTDQRRIPLNATLLNATSTAAPASTTAALSNTTVAAGQANVAAASSNVRAAPTYATLATQKNLTNSNSTNSTTNPMTAFTTAAATPSASFVFMYSLDIPADPGLVVPGDYMLFALGPNGTPSVATAVSIKPSH